MSVNTMNMYMLVEEEIWKKHPKHDLEVSNLGNVRNLDGTSVKLWKSKGYWLLTKKFRAVHRLVIETFKPNTVENSYFDCVDHINRVKSDNRISNLRWSNKTLNNLNVSGVKGYWKSPSGNFRAEGKLWKIKKSLGTHKFTEDAKRAADIQREKNTDIAQFMFERFDAISSRIRYLNRN